MAVLVIAEHDNAQLKGATNNVVTAAAKIGGDIHVLVTGQNVAAVAEQAAKIAGVSKVLAADGASLADGLAENVAEQVISLFAGTRGFMDDVPVESVRKFEEGLQEYFANAKSDILNEIREKKALDDGLIARLGAAIDEFKKGFKA